MKKLGLVGLMVLTTLGCATSQSRNPASRGGGFSSGPTRFKGILCTGTEKIDGIEPMVIIRDISKTNATLYLDMGGGLPDIRNSSLDVTTKNGQALVGYVSHASDINRYAPKFAIYTNGSTPQDTTSAVLTFDGSDKKIQMTCQDGMKLE